LKNGQRSLSDSLASLLQSSVGKLCRSASEYPVFTHSSAIVAQLLQVWLAVARTPTAVRSDIETTPPSDGGSETGLIVGVVVGSLILLTIGLGVGQLVSWETMFNFIFRTALMLPFTEAMFSVCLSIYSVPNHSVYSLVAQCIYDLAGIRQTLHRNLDGGSSVYQN
jgi:hypothetical protein